METDHTETIVDKAVAYVRTFSAYRPATAPQT
jgi:hypothetical protein